MTVHDINKLIKIISSNEQRIEKLESVLLPQNHPSEEELLRTPDPFNLKYTQYEEKPKDSDSFPSSRPHSTKEKLSHQIEVTNKLNRENVQLTAEIERLKSELKEACDQIEAQMRFKQSPDTYYSRNCKALEYYYDNTDILDEKMIEILEGKS